ncbi:MAG: cupin domain-containing protein [Janthinobacterium lividum]
MTAEQTGGRLGLLEVTVPAGEGTPLHRHEREDEFFQVLAGRVAFSCGEDHVELMEGGSIFLPRGIPHRFSNLGDDPARLLVIVTPGGFEGFFGAVADQRVSGPKELAGLAATYGLTFLG